MSLEYKVRSEILNKLIYMDNAATTKIDEKVFNKMKPYLIGNYGNPSSIHSLGRKAKQTIDDSRFKIANLLNVSFKELYFTSGATESNNWAIKKIAEYNKANGNHIITSKIEHPSVLETCKYLEKKGFKVTYIDVDKEGIVKVDDVKSAINSDTILVSIMMVNNEIGTIQPIEEISKLIKDTNIVFHVDAVQAIGKIDFDIEALGIDSMSISGHKFNGPKGIGLLYLKKGVAIESLIHGGSQERNLRAGTENVHNIVGFAKALEISQNSITKNNEIILDNRNYMITKLNNEFDNIVFNGNLKKALPSIINIGIKDVSSEALMMNLDIEGICVSSGSACASGSMGQSHVIKALEVDSNYGIIRFSLSKDNTREEVEYVIDKLNMIINRLR